MVWRAMVLYAFYMARNQKNDIFSLRHGEIVINLRCKSLMQSPGPGKRGWGADIEDKAFISANS